MLRKIRLFTAILLLTGIGGCYTVPETGRSTLNLIPEDQLISQSAQAFSELKTQAPLSQNLDHNDRVQRVGRRIAAVVGDDLPEVDWEFVVFDDPSQINAFAMPGGKVGVYTGMLQVASNDAQIAIVIGHEIAHVAARHANERVSHALLLETGAVGLSVATKDMEGFTRQALASAYGLGSSLGVQLPFSRLHESEADKIGLFYAARAGYDPREALRFWENMASAAGASKPPEFLSTHPSYSTRIQDLESLMPEALEIYRQATGN